MKDPGEQYVTMAGAPKMPLWSVECWDTTVRSLPSQQQQVSPQQPSTSPSLAWEIMHAQKAPQQGPLHKQQESKEDFPKRAACSPWDEGAARQVLLELCPKA